MQLPFSADLGLRSSSLHPNTSHYKEKNVNKNSSTGFRSVPQGRFLFVSTIRKTDQSMRRPLTRSFITNTSNVARLAKGHGIAVFKLQCGHWIDSTEGGTDRDWRCLSTSVRKAILGKTNYIHIQCRRAPHAYPKGQWSILPMFP